MRLNTLLAAFAAGLFVWTGGAAETAPNQAFRPKTRILFVGDSITQNGWNHPDGYVRLMEAALKELETGCTVLPGGVSGQKSNDMLKRIDRELKERKPDIVLFSCGVNDVWHGMGDPKKGVSQADYIRNCGQIFDRVIAANATPVVLTPTMIGEDPKSGGNKLLDPYVAALKEYAASRKIPVIDLNAAMHAALETTPANRAGLRLTFDGVHMNWVGDRMMARTILAGFGLAGQKEAEILKAWDKLRWEGLWDLGSDGRYIYFSKETGLPKFMQLPKLPFDPKTARACGLTRLGGRTMMSQLTAGDWTCDVRGTIGRMGEDVWEYDFTYQGKARPDLALKITIPPKASPMLEKIKASGLKLTHIDQYLAACRRFYIDFEGWEGWIVEPSNEKLRKDGAWVWCMKWPGAFPEGSGQIDALKRGYYYVYLDNKLWMSEEGTRRAKAWRDLIVSKLGLAPKTYLIGMSWGGFFSTRYAATYPEDVAKVYLDNPLMGFHAFAAWGWNGVPEAWGIRKDDGHDWRHDPRMPINLGARLAAAKIPVLLLYGDKDTTCVPSENCLIFKEGFEKAGGDLTVVLRPGRNHHPHGFIDPVDGNKVIDFFEK